MRPRWTRGGPGGGLNKPFVIVFLIVILTYNVPNFQEEDSSPFKRLLKVPGDEYVDWGYEHGQYRHTYPMYNPRVLQKFS